jgi:drug/metabolite transporter (DMT)-like permease
MTMSWAVFAAALLSALLHAAWNVLAKMQPAPGDCVLGIIIACASLCALVLPFVGLPPSRAWPWLLTAALCNVLYSRALMAAYDRTGFATAYPVARAAIPPAAVLLGWILLSEPPPSGALLGLAVVVGALLLFAMPAGHLRRRDLGGLLFAGASGSALALGFVLDTAGIRLMEGGPVDFIGYCVANSLVTALALTATFLVEHRNPIRVLIERPGPCYLGAVLLLGSAFAGLWAYAQGPVALVATVREGNILLGGLLAVLLLDERVGRTQWAAMALAATGAALIKLA